MPDDFIERLAGLLSGDPAMIEALTFDEERDVLELARVVAHGTERKNAPLACYLAGLSVAAATGEERAAALRRALDAARSLLDEGDQPSPV
jgi:hypothetical protein